MEQHEPKVTIPVIAAQKPARYWAVFDAEGRKGFRVVHAGFSQDRIDALFNVPAFIRRGDTLEELARNAELPVESLVATVDRYNGLVEGGEDTDFKRFGPKVRVRGFGPPARKIAQAPFYAAPMHILIRKSMGGINVDIACRVLNQDGKPVPGLLAAGEATGFGGLNGRNGLEGTFLGPSILMGRVAAQTVAAAVKPTPATAPASDLRTAPSAVNPKLESTCKGCHDVAKLVAETRPGFWHFGQAHRLVLSRGLNCIGCHAELAPFRLETHKINAALQTAVCQHCHMSPPFGGRRPPVEQVHLQSTAL